MCGEHLTVVHLVDVVAGENEDIIGVIAVDEIEVLVDGIGGSLVPVRTRFSLIRRQYGGTALVSVKIPRAAVADVFVQYERLILCQHAYGVNA